MHIKLFKFLKGKKESTKEKAIYLRWNYGESFMEKLTFAPVFIGGKRKGIL